MPKSLVFSTFALAAGLVLAACGTDAAPGPGSQTSSVGQVCGGSAGAACGAGDYCRIKPPYSPDKTGVCVRRPDMCNMLYQPVCGVDGKTYPNSCHADRSGVMIAKEGACAK